MGDMEWDRWQGALEGRRIESERGNPASGFYKRNADANRVEAICIYRDDGELRCIRNIFGDGSKMTADEIDELYASCSMYPISHADYAAVAEEGNAFPPEFATRLTMKEIEAGLVWSPALGRKKLAAATMLAENERAVIGDNSQNAEPHELLLGRINDLADRRRTWLKEIGGTVSTQDHADKAADFAEAFARLEKEAASAHKVEKEPHLTAGREVDAKWKPIAAKAEDAKREAKAMLTPYLRAQEEERRRIAAKDAAEARQRQQSASAPVEPVKARAGHSGRGVSLRTVTKCVITDLPSLAGFIAKMQTPPPDFADACRKAADKMLRARVEVPGAKLEESQEAA